jgi:hypothetical protein
MKNHGRAYSDLLRQFWPRLTGQRKCWRGAVRYTRCDPIDALPVRHGRRKKLSGYAAPLVLALALTGCATTHTRWVQTYCVTPDQYAKLEQAEPSKIGSQLDGNAQHDLKLIAGNDVELRTFSDGLLGVIGGCVDPNTEAPTH